MQSLSTGNFDSERVDISLVALLKYRQQGGKGYERLQKAYCRGKGFFYSNNHEGGKKMKRIKMIAFVLVLLALFVGTPVLSEAADVLHMYTALDPNEAKVYIEAFMKDTKINVEWVRMSAGEVLTRLKAEAKNPQVSLWFGGPSTEFIAGKKEGLLSPLQVTGGSSFSQGELEGCRRLLDRFLFRRHRVRQQYQLVRKEQGSVPHLMARSPQT